LYQHGTHQGLGHFINLNRIKNKWFANFIYAVYKMDTYAQHELVTSVKPMRPPKKRRNTMNKKEKGAIQKWPQKTGQRFK